jgi:hypothetical protein
MYVYIYIYIKPLNPIYNTYIPVSSAAASSLRLHLAPGLPVHRKIYFTYLYIGKYILLTVHLAPGLPVGFRV